MKSFTIRFTEQELAALDVLAKRDGRSRSAIIRDVVSNYFAADSKPWPASIGMIKEDDGTLTSDNVDEWLRANWHPE